MNWKSGVYLILNKINGKAYVGSATGSIEGRIKSHIYSLRKGTHINRHLQYAWNKYGEKAFEFLVLERCTPNECLSREQHYLDTYQSFDHKKGYNICRYAGNTKGVIYPPEVRAKFAAGQKAAHARPEVKQRHADTRAKPEFKRKHAAAMKLVTEAPEYRRKMSASVTVALASPEAKANISAGVKRAYANDPTFRERVRQAGIGRKHSEATKAKIAAAHARPEVKESIRQKLKGRKFSDATKQKMRKPKSAEAVKNIAEGARRGWLTRRANLAKECPSQLLLFQTD